jgi:hypothetical protein
MQPSRQSLAEADCLDLIHMRSQAIDTMNEWIIQRGGAQDFLDDPNLYSAMRSFLDNSSHHTPPASPAFDNFAVRQTWTACEQSKKSLMSSFISQTTRPTSRDVSALKVHIGNVKSRNLSTDPPDIDRIEPEQLVETLDAMAAAAFSNVSEEVSPFLVFR